MPNETDDKNNGANNGDAGAGAGAGSGTGDGKNPDAGAGQGAAGDETITIKKADYDKVVSDRDNYRDGLLGKKADERNLDGKKPDVKVPDPVPAVIDEKKIAETATATVSKLLRDSAEKSAKRTFLQKHPEYLDDTQWSAMVSNLTFKGGEVSSEEVLDRMEAAVLEHKRSTGKLDEYLQQERERGVREGRIQGNMDAGRGTGGAGDKNGSGKGVGILSSKGEEMARAMHTDPEKVKKVDTSKDNVINVL